MERLAYFDCSSGVAGDMILGCLLSAGLDEKAWRREIARLQLPVRIKVGRVRRGIVGATAVEVVVLKREGERGLREIVRLIKRTRLSRAVSERSVAIFERLARAEAKVHGTSIGHVHFHEVGGCDCIVDIVGAVVGFELLGIDRVVASPVNLGSGVVKFSHGVLPVPAPATAELLKGVPVYQPPEAVGELTTPTGAALLREFAENFGPLPPMRISAIGCGAGNLPTPWPNVLRVFIGMEEKTLGLPGTERVGIVEANIDDMNPQLFDYVLERLFAAGALDVYLTPIQMKKNRPATLLTAVGPVAIRDRLSRIILTETTTLGVRYSEMSRSCLGREMVTVPTRFGPVAVKLGKLDGKTVNAAPEYESARALARKTSVPLKLIFASAHSVASRKYLR
jgi:hypothetical protein